MSHCAAAGQPPNRVCRLQPGLQWKAPRSTPFARRDSPLWSAAGNFVPAQPAMGCCLEMLIGPLFGCSAGPSATSASAVHECVGSVLESWLIFAARETSALPYTRDCSGNNEKRIRIAIVRWWGHGGILLSATRLLCRLGFLFCEMLSDWQQRRTAPGPRRRGGKLCDCVIVGLLGRVTEPDPERTRERGGTGASRRRFFPAFYGNKPNLDITAPRQNMPSSHVLPFHLGDLGLTSSTSVS